MIPRNISRRGIWAVGVSFFLVVVLLSQGSRISSAAGISNHLLGDIGNATIGFEKIFVIGLPSRSDRRDGMALQAALTNLDFEFVDGALDTEIPERAIPAARNGKHAAGPALGAWRGHMNAIREIVRRNISSALILEDDVDWDVRLRQQLHDFALSTQALTQPLLGTSSSYIDPTYPFPSENSPKSVPDIPFHQLPATVPAKWSPYGDTWDLLWIGHCGMHFPFEKNQAIPKGRIIHHNDMTVPEQKHLGNINIPHTLVEKYPAHTRVVHHAQEAVCTLGYAVTQKAARQMLEEIALRPVDTAMDILLRFFCEGAKGRSHHRCLTPQPAFFHHHRPAGPTNSESDISNHGGGYRDVAMTNVVRWSVRLNANTLSEGGTAFIDQYPDGSK